MKYNAQDYLDAAMEHVHGANSLYSMGHYVLAHYVAGLATECLLRAYRLLKDKTFDERHDLWAIATAADFLDIVPTDQRQKISAALGEVVVRWRNEHRYCSKASLQRSLKDNKLYFKIKGDIVKENCRRIVNAAFDLVNLGAIAWKNH